MASEIDQKKSIIAGSHRGDLRQNNKRRLIICYDNILLRPRENQSDAVRCVVMDQ